jgi:hypothetical protein
VYKEGGHGTAAIKVKYNRLESAHSADVTKTDASSIGGRPVAISTANDGLTPNAYDTSASDGSITGQYRWFWKYFDSDDNHELGNFGSTDAEISKCFRDNKSNCELDAFPDSVNTTKMKYIYFAAPIASSKRVKYTDPKDFVLTNTKINASAGAIKRLRVNNADPTSDVRIIKIADATADNDSVTTTYHEYEVFYLELDGANLDTNTYSLSYTTN